MPSQVTYKPSHKVDFVIVGCGSSGGVLAKELSTAGFSVVALEQGPYIPPSDFGHDEIAQSQEHALTNKPDLSPQTFRKTPQDKAEKQSCVMYGRCVGGGPVHFTANYWRFHEIDFIERAGGPHRGHRICGLAHHLRRPGALLHQSRMGSWRIGRGGGQSVRSVSLQALSAAADAGEILRRDVRARRAQDGIASLSLADGDYVAAVPRPHGLQSLRTVPGLRLRVGAKSARWPRWFRWRIRPGAAKSALKAMFPGGD